VSSTYPICADQPERRVHQRLAASYAVECSPTGDERPHEGAGDPAHSPYRTVSINVSSGGLCFLAEPDRFQPGMRLDLGLAVPPGEGHFPYPGRMEARAEVLRVESLPLRLRPNADPGGHPDRVGVAARFCKPLELHFPAGG